MSFPGVRPGDPAFGTPYFGITGINPHKGPVGWRTDRYLILIKISVDGPEAKKVEGGDTSHEP